MNWWLIQRLEAPRTGAMSALGEAFSFGGGLRNGGLSEEAMSLLRRIFSFDYMGAAEFEFGAIPEAFRDLAKAKLVAYKVNVGGATIYVLSEEDIKDKVPNAIQELYDNPYGRTKERTQLKEAIENVLTPGKHTYARTQGWLVLEAEPCMFFVNEDMWKNTCTLFGVNPD